MKFPSHPPDTKISEEEYSAFSKSFECVHGDSKLRWRNAKKQSVFLQCLNCGGTVGTAIKHSALSPSEYSSLGMWDEALAKNYSDLRLQAYESKKQEKDTAWWDWYNSYLESPAWKAKREAVLIRENWKCQGCREKSATQVHHLSYEHAGNELLFELAAVCDECHDTVHTGNP